MKGFFMFNKYRIGYIEIPIRESRLEINGN